MRHINLYVYKNTRCPDFRVISYEPIYILGVALTLTTIYSVILKNNV